MKKILNPIEFFNDKKLLITNLIIFVIGTVISVFMKGIFGSPIDLHFTTEIDILTSVLGNLSAIITMAIVLFITGKIINKKTRLVDCLNLALYIRIPYYILTFWNITGTFSNMQAEFDNQNNIIIALPSSMTDMLIMAGFSLFTLIALALKGILIYFGFKTITNSKKISDYLILAVLVIISVILSYALAKNF